MDICHYEYIKLHEFITNLRTNKKITIVRHRATSSFNILYSKSTVIAEALYTRHYSSIVISLRIYSRGIISSPLLLLYNNVFSEHRVTSRRQTVSHLFDLSFGRHSYSLHWWRPAPWPVLYRRVMIELRDWDKQEGRRTYFLSLIHYGRDETLYVSVQWDGHAMSNARINREPWRAARKFYRCQAWGMLDMDWNVETQGLQLWRTKCYV